MALMASCNLSEYEADCKGDLKLTFRFTQNEQNGFGPQVSSLSVFVFDRQGAFYGRWDENDNSKFGADYVMTLPLPPGTYDFVVWGGVNDAQYEICLRGGSATAPVIGQTLIGDLAVRLAANHSNEISYIPAGQYHGEMLGKTIEAGEDNDVTVELVKNNTEIQLTVLGLPSPETRSGSQFTQMGLWFTAPNGSYDFHNAMDHSAPALTYREQGTTDGADNALLTSFHTMRLQLKDDNNTNIPYTYTIWNSQTGSVYHTADLLHDFICKTEGGRYDTQAEIDAVDVFKIVIDLHPNAAVSVTVNGWRVNTSGSILQ